MKNSSYILNKDILTIKTAFGHYSFKIEDSDMLDDVERIVRLMFNEMDSLDKKLNFRKERAGQYAKLLLTNLNLCEKYVKLEDSYRTITDRLEAINRKLESAAISTQLSEIISEPLEVSVEQITEPVEAEPVKVESVEAESTEIVPQSESESNVELIQAQTGYLESKEELEEDTEDLNDNEQTTLSSYKRVARPEISNWKLTQSYLSLKQKAMERIMQIRGQYQQQEREDNCVDAVVTEPSLIESSIMAQELSNQEVSNQDLSNKEPIEPITQQQTFQASEPTYTITRPIESHKSINTPNILKPKVYRKGEFQLPNLSFLKNTSIQTEVDHHGIRRDAELLEKKLGYFGIKGEVMGVSPGPVITTFEYRPEPGIKISKIVNLADDLALALSAFSIRIVAPIPGKDVMGIEIPNIKKSLVPFIDIVSSDNFINSKSKLPICLGKDIVGNPVVVELDKMPHLLIAGATGTGKSVGLNAMIASILYKSTPEEVRFLMVDPKRIELSFYNDIPHLLTPVITDMKKATIALQWLVREMDRRYTLLAKSQVRHIEQYNQKIKRGDYISDLENPEQLPYIVVIIDELADLMMTASRDIEFSLTRLAQMARAAGIHLILATQRPSVDVLTGIIKANFPTRISFQVSSKTDSRTIIDSNGAETLLGNGDMLFVPPGTARLTRVHGTYLSENELMEITSFLKSQGKPEYVLDVITETDEEPPQESMDDDYDDKYNEALEFVIATKQASISGIQRALRVGYNRAARIIDIMEKRGIVGPSDGVKPRRVILENIQY
ncbi:MAG: DNA translocase FtsK [Desulfamplus sp.]